MTAASLAVVQENVGQVRLDWSASSGADKYRIYRDDLLIDSVSSPTLFYEDTGGPGDYTYGIAAGNPCGWSDSTTSVGTVPPDAPGAPATVTASDTSCTVVRIDWSASPDALGTTLFRWDQGGDSGRRRPWTVRLGRLELPPVGNGIHVTSRLLTVLLFAPRLLVAVATLVLAAVWWILIRVFRLDTWPLARGLDGIGRAYPSVLGSALRLRWVIVPSTFVLLFLVLTVVPRLGTQPTLTGHARSPGYGRENAEIGVARITRVFGARVVVVTVELIAEVGAAVGRRAPDDDRSK